MEITGDLECSDGNCPSATKKSLYDFTKNQMCPVSDDGGDDGNDGSDDGDDGDYDFVCTASVRVLCDQLR